MMYSSLHRVIFWFAATALTLSPLMSRAVAAPGGEMAQPNPSEDSRSAAAAPKCPIEGAPADFSIAVSRNEGPVFFCGKACAEKYEASPDIYAEAVVEQRKALADRPRVQVRCPVQPFRSADANFTIDHEGTKILFCCRGCPARFQKDPERFAAPLANAYTFQTKCPVTGSEVVGKHFAKLTSGQVIYFATAEAKQSFLAEPEKYVGQLASQSIKVDPQQVKEEK